MNTAGIDNFFTYYWWHDGS